MLVAQVTDSHIVAKGKDWRSRPDTDTAGRLKKAIAAINALSPKPNVVFITGDNVDDGAAESYAHLKEILAALTVPFFIIPGNHDKRDNLRAAFPAMPYQGDFLELTVTDYALGIIGLDSVIPGKDEGALCEKRIEWLKQTLTAHATKKFLIFLHHYPVNVGQRFFDRLKLTSNPVFENMVRTNDGIIALACGHNHRPLTLSYGGKPCFIGQSTAPSYHFPSPDTESGERIELTPPAFTLYKWDGRALSQRTVEIP